MTYVEAKLVGELETGLIELKTNPSKKIIRRLVSISDELRSEALTTIATDVWFQRQSGMHSRIDTSRYTKPISPLLKALEEKELAANSDWKPVYQEFIQRVQNTIDAIQAA